MKVVPRPSTTNEDVEHFATPLADGYEAIADLLATAVEQWCWPERERIFWETVISRDRYEIRMATRARTAEMARQQVEATWPTAVLEPAEDDHLLPFGPDTDAWHLRLRFPHFLSLSTDRRKLAPLPLLLELSRQFRGDDYAVIQFGFQAAEPDWWKDAATDRREFDRGHKPREWRKVGHLSEATEQKLAGQGFDFVLRVLVRSDDPRRRQRLGRGLCTGLASLNADNQFEARRVPGWRFGRFLRDVRARRLQVPFFSGRRDILTPAEIGRLLQLPPRSLQQEYGIVAAVAQRESKVPAALRRGGVKIGTVRQKDGEVDVFLPTSNMDEFCLPHVAIAEMGGGKDTLAANLVVEGRLHGIGSFLVDVVDEKNRGMSDQVRDTFAPDELEQYIEVDLGNTDWPIAQDWHEGLGAGREANRRMAAELSTFLGTGDMTDTDHWLRAAARAVGGNPLHIANMLSPDPNPYREQVLRRLRVERQVFLVREWEAYTALGERKQAQIAGYVQSRLVKIISDDAMRNIFCQEPKVVSGKRVVDYARWMREGKTVVVKIPKKVFMKSGTPRVFHHQLVKIWLAKMAIGADGPTFLILNEIHQMLGANFEACVDLLEDIVVEARKYRLIPVFLFHDWAQVPRDLRDILISAGPHLHLGASSKKTYEALKEELVDFTGDVSTVVEECLRIEKKDWLHVIRAEGKRQTPFVARGLRPPKERLYAYENWYRGEECARLFGRPVEEVEAQLYATLCSATQTNTA